MKKCFKCRCEMPATREYFYRNRNNQDGFRDECIRCFKEYSTLYRARRKAGVVIRESLKETPICVCGNPCPPGKCYCSKGCRDADTLDTTIWLQSVCRRLAAKQVSPDMKGSIPHGKIIRK